MKILCSLKDIKTNKTNGNKYSKRFLKHYYGNQEVDMTNRGVDLSVNGLEKEEWLMSV